MIDWRTIGGPNIFAKISRPGCSNKSKCPYLTRIVSLNAFSAIDVSAKQRGLSIQG